MNGGRCIKVRIRTQQNYIQQSVISGGGMTAQCPPTQGSAEGWRTRQLIGHIKQTPAERGRIVDLWCFSTRSTVEQCFQLSSLFLVLVHKQATDATRVPLTPLF